MAVVGFDNMRFSGMVDPPMTTVNIDKYKLGHQAMSRLVEMLRNPETHYPPINLGVELVVRKSA